MNWTFLLDFKIGKKTKIQIKDFVDNNLILTAYVLRLGF